MVWGALAVVAAWIVFWVDPATSSIYPSCPFHWLTGLDCPLCGSLRAMHLLLHGHLGLALQSNALTVTSMAVLTASTVGRRLGHAGWAAGGRRWSRNEIALFAACGILFGVVRNLPGDLFHYLRP